MKSPGGNMKKSFYSIQRPTTGLTHNLPIFLDNTIIDLGVMVGFDGYMGQTNQQCNFTYAGNGSGVTIYNTVNTSDLPTLTDSIFTIYWGDSTSSTLPMLKIGDTTLPYTGHTYTGTGTYTITVTVESPWDVQEVKKEIVIPFIPSYGYPVDLGVLTFTVPYTDPEVTGVTQQYLEDYQIQTGNTNPTTIRLYTPTPQPGFSFVAMGKSRIDEFKKYGSTTNYSGVTITSGYTGYTIDDLYYMDYADGYTQITGTTSGTTIQFYHEEVYNGMITRNEHFLCFIDEPTIFSDIFVERGKMGVMEKNLRLGEIDNTGELEIYGNGYFNIRKQ